MILLIYKDKYIKIGLDTSEIDKKEAQEIIDNALAYENEATSRLAKIDKKRKDI